MFHRPRTVLAFTLGASAALLAAPSVQAGPMQLGLADRDGVPVLWVWGSDTADVLELGHVDSEKITLTPGAGSTLALAGPGHTGAATHCTEAAGVWTCSLNGLGKWAQGSVTREQFGASLGAGDDRFTAAKGVHENTVHGIVVLGEAGNDAIIGRDELDSFHGGEGHDDLRPHVGADIANGGDGNDLLMTSAHELGGFFTSPADRDHPSTTCGPGIDLVVRDSDNADDGIDLASCEADAGAADLAAVRSEPDFGRLTYEPGMAVGVSWKSTRSVPDLIENVWETCGAPTVSGNVSVPNCTEFARVDRLTIDPSLIGKTVRVTSRAFYSIPGNPSGPWPAGQRISDGRKVTEAIGVRPSPPVPTGPTRDEVRDRLMAALVPKSKPRMTIRLAKPGFVLRGDATPHAARIVASLSVDRKLLGERRKGTATIAKLDTSVTGTFTQPLPLNGAGKKLRSRLGKNGIAKAKLRIWLQVGASGPSGSSTVPVKLKGR